jgi:hypothetical protein
LQLPRRVHRHLSFYRHMRALQHEVQGRRATQTFRAHRVRGSQEGQGAGRDPSITKYEQLKLRPCCRSIKELLNGCLAELTPIHVL